MDCRYITSALKPEQLPDFQQPEVAFIGRSNAGKSSLINALLGRRTLARKGRTPGQTQMINFFSINDKMVVADLPGFGFSAVDKNVAEKWQPLVEAYVRRTNIREFMFLVDCRRELTDVDDELMFILGRQLPLYVLLTKTDKISRQALQARMQKLAKELQNKGIEVRKIVGVSSMKQTGLEEVRADLFAWMDEAETQSI
jgi:GTP-binding protein